MSRGYAGPLSEAPTAFPSHSGGEDSSGLLTADGVIIAGPALLSGVILTPAAADSTLILYDNDAAAAGKVLTKLFVKASTSSLLWIPIRGIIARNGIFADITGLAAEFQVFWVN